MVTPLKYSVGLDFSKADIKACISVISSDQNVVVKATRTFINTLKDAENADIWIKKHCKLNIPVVITMEATGNYYEIFALFLHRKGYYVSVVLPNKAKKYMESRGLKTKNDPVDARGLAQMGAEQRLDQWEPLSESIYQLRLLTRHYEGLVVQKTQINNQMTSQQSGMYISSKVIKHMRQLIELIEKQKKETLKLAEQIVNEDPYLNERFAKILKIKGIGFITLAAVIAETNAFSLIKNQRQLTSYAGYDVIENASGKRVGKTRISKKGNSHIRRAMHMPALNMVRYQNKYFTDLYNRVFSRTNIKMKAYVAVQRKLLILIYTLWKKNEDYVENLNITSGNDEPKFLFSVGFEKAGNKKVVPAIKARTTQDELPCNELPKVLFSV
jgi:transposase